MTLDEIKKKQKKANCDAKSLTARCPG